MQTALKYPVIPGGLSSADHDRIQEMAEAGRKPSRIAQLIGKHPSTVRWYMYRQGLCALSGKTQPGYVRNGRPVRPFTPDEDRLAVELRRQNLGSIEIAKRLAARFGFERSSHTIRIRLAMLAASEEAGHEA